MLQQFDKYNEFKNLHWRTITQEDIADEARKLIKYRNKWVEYCQGKPHADESEDDEDGNDIMRIEDEHDPENDTEQEFREFSFHLESHLRDALAKDLNLIEQGLTLYKDTESDKNGVEFTVGSGRIDILAVDTNGQFVVIELKKFRGRNRALGQILYYMGWIEKNMPNGNNCRGIIIANEIDEELKIAALCVKNILLCNYSVKFELKKLNG